MNIEIAYHQNKYLHFVPRWIGNNIFNQRVSGLSKSIKDDVPLKSFASHRQDHLSADVKFRVVGQLTYVEAIFALNMPHSEY